MAPLTLAAGLVAAIGAIALLERLAPRLGLVDQPGGRKDHAGTVPLVGGLGILVGLLVAHSGSTGPAGEAFLAAATLLAAVGALDDRSELNPRVKFAAQLVAAVIMIFSAGIELHSLGDLLGWRALGLAWLSIPLTLFATVGVINAVNMVDGQDGLAGLLCLIAFGWYGLVAAQSGLGSQAAMAWSVAAAVAGFLAFNLRLPWRPRARVFLGDAGSLMLGFALAWLAIDLTQGPRRSFYPIAALWVLILPLADCVSLMTRRLLAGRSPFVADREHIHHYLSARGLTVTQSTWLLAAISALFGAVGYFEIGRAHV